MSLRITIAVSLVAWVTIGGQVRSDDSAKSLLTQEYPAQRAKLRAITVATPHTRTTNVTRHDGQHVVLAVTQRMARATDQFLYSVEIQPGGPTKLNGVPFNVYAVGRNQHYYFEIGAKEGNGWVLKNLLMPIPTDLVEALPTEESRKWAFPGTVGKKPMLPAQAVSKAVYDTFDDLQKSPGFRLVDVSHADPDGHIVRVSYSSLYADFYIMTPTPANCTVDFDRRHYWAVVRARKTVPEHSLTWELDITSQYLDKLPTLQQSVTTVRSNHKNRDIERTVVDTRIDYGDPAPGRISLSAFGLPEPPGVVWDKPTPTYVWLLSAAGGMAVVGILVAGFARWRRSRSASPG